jgi:predicted transcriptional regulator
MSDKVTIEISDADLAELREWAANSERSVEALLQEALERYMIRNRVWIEEIKEAEKGPFSSAGEVKARLADRRSRYRDEAAE